MDERQPSSRVPIPRLLLEIIVVGLSSLVFIIFVSGLFYLVLNGGDWADAPEVPGGFNETKILAGFFGAPLIMFGTLVVGDAMLRKRQVSLRKLGIKRPESLAVTLLQGLGLTVFLLGFWVITWNIYTSNGLGFPFYAPDVFKGDEFRFFYALTMVSWVAGGIGEEALFRGFFLNNFMEMFRGKKVGIFIAVVLQAFIFIFLHLDAQLAEFPLWVVRAVPVFLTGLFLGGAYFLFNRNLWPLIIAHGVLSNIYYIMVYNEVIG